MFINTAAYDARCLVRVAGINGCFLFPEAEQRPYVDYSGYAKQDVGYAMPNPCVDSMDGQSFTERPDH